MAGSSKDIQLSELKDVILQLNTTIKTLNDTITKLQAENDAQKAELAWFRQKMFGSSSERHVVPMEGQMSLPFLAETPEEEKPVELIEPEVVELPKKPRKAKPSLKEQFKDIPVRQVTVDTLTEEEKQCPLCGTEMVPIGTELIRSEIVYTPPKLERIEYMAVTYSCPECKETEEPQFIKDNGIYFYMTHILQLLSRQPGTFGDGVFNGILWGVTKKFFSFSDMETHMFHKKGQTAPDLFTVFGDHIFKVHQIYDRFFVESFGVDLTIPLQCHGFSSADIDDFAAAFFFFHRQSKRPSQIADMDDLQQGVALSRQIKSFPLKYVGDEVVPATAQIVKRQFAGTGDTAGTEDRTFKISLCHLLYGTPVAVDLAAESLIDPGGEGMFFICRQILQRRVNTGGTAVQVTAVMIFESGEYSDRFRMRHRVDDGIILTFDHYPGKFFFIKFVAGDMGETGNSGMIMPFGPPGENFRVMSSLCQFQNDIVTDPSGPADYENFHLADSFLNAGYHNRYLYR